MSRPFFSIWRANEGVTTIEFAVLAPILFYFILSAFEIGLIYTQRELLDRAVVNAVKQVYIGAATSGVVTKEDLETSICEDLMMAGSNCRGNLMMELQPIDSMSTLPTTNAVCRDSSVPIAPTVTYNPGQTDSFVFMRICYMMDLIMPGTRFVLQLPTSNGKVALISSNAFRNEPF